MHISEGVLSAPVLVGCGAVAAGCVGIGLAKMREEDVVKTAVLTSALFVATLIRVPVGPSAVHLILNGLAGLILGWQVFPAFAVALLLQATLFGFGGISTLGVNVLILGAPGIVCYHLFITAARGVPQRFVFWIGAAAGALAIGIGGLMLAAALITTGEEFKVVAGVVLVAHLPVLVVEGLVTGVALSFLRKVRPETLMKQPGSMEKLGENS